MSADGRWAGLEHGHLVSLTTGQHYLHEASLAERNPYCTICAGLAEPGRIWPTDDEIQEAWDNLGTERGTELGPLSEGAIARIRERANSPWWRRFWCHRHAGNPL